MDELLPTVDKLCKQRGEMLEQPPATEAAAKSEPELSGGRRRRGKKSRKSRKGKKPRKGKKSRKNKRTKRR
jgi:hypothetical protein